jgi:beta-aspartyl-peptidase (threonine type)
MKPTQKKFGIVIHGGAGGIKRENNSPEEEQAYLKALENSIDAAYLILEQEGSSIDAVTEAVKILEDCPLYNAGCGAVMNALGKHELDASIMDGATGKSGGVGIVTTIKNPILAARKVMEESPHTLLAADGAEGFAKQYSLEEVNNEYFTTELRKQQYLKAKKKNKILLDHETDSSKGSVGTVGAVALDQNGNVAAATSTGGLTNKFPGRIGDTAVIGAGTYASNKTAAISCTGTGDTFLAISASKTVSDLMQYKNLNLKDAAKYTLIEIKKKNGIGGIIGITKDCEIVEAFITEGMFRGHHLSNGRKKVLMYK